VLLNEISVGFVKTLMWLQAGPSAIAAMDKAANILQDNDIVFEHTSLPTEFGNDAAIRPLVDNLAARHSVIVTPGAMDEAPVG
jgi:hypothetical protein